MENIKLNYPDNDVLLMYRCGSYNYGTKTNDSDEDFVVVLDDFKGMSHIGENKKEYFIFGLNAWKDKMEFNKTLDGYYLVFNDEIVNTPNNIIYVDDSVKELVEHYKSDFINNIGSWLEVVINYFRADLKELKITKTLYHLKRIRMLVERLLATGSFSLELNEEETNELIRFKNARDKISELNELKNDLTYLEKVKEEQLWKLQK